MGEFGANGIDESKEIKVENRPELDNYVPSALQVEEAPQIPEEPIVATEPQQPTFEQIPELDTSSLENFAESWAEQSADEAMKMFGALKREIHEAFGIAENNPDALDLEAQSRIEALAQAVQSNQPDEIEHELSSLFDGSIDSPERLNQLAGLMIGQGGGNFEGLSIGGKNPLSEEQLRQRREQERTANAAAIDSATKAALAMDNYKFTQEEVKRAFAVIQNGMTPADNAQLDAAVAANSDGEVTAADAADMQVAIDRQIEIMRQDPAFDVYSDEQLRALAEMYTVEHIMEQNNVSAEEAREILLQSVQAFQQMTPEEKTAALNIAVASSMAYKNTQTSQAAAAEALAASSSLNNKALELTDSMKRDMVVSLDYDIGGGDAHRTSVYMGYGISEDGKTLITEGDGPIQYFTSFNNDTFQPIPLEYAIATENNSGPELADQIEASGYTIDNMDAELKGYLEQDLGVTTQAELLNYLRTDPNAHPALSILMGDDNFVNTVGNYALQLEIQAELDKGQVFANDPALEQKIADQLSKQGWTTEYREERVELLQTLVTTMEDLESQKASLELDAANPIFRNAFQAEIADIDNQINTIKMQLEETRQALLIELEDANQWYEREAQAAAEYATQNPDFPIPMGDPMGWEYTPGQSVNEAYAAQQHALEMLQIVSDSLGVAMPEPPAEELVAEAPTADDGEPAWDRSNYSYLEEDAARVADEILASGQPISMEQLEAMATHDNMLGAFGENGLLMLKAVLEEKAPAYEFSNGPLPAHYIELNVAKEIYDDISLDSISKEEIMNRLADAGLSGEQLAASTEQVIADIQTDIGMDFVTGLNWPSDNADAVYGADHTLEDEIEEPTPVANNEGPAPTEDYAYNNVNSPGAGPV